jgi:hypothetical protein
VANLTEAFCCYLDLQPPVFIALDDEATNFFYAVCYTGPRGLFLLEDGLWLTPAWSVISPALYFYRSFFCRSYYTLEWDGFAKPLGDGTILLGKTASICLGT